ncbi:Hpt domain-containing protein [Brevundimonas sp. Root1423]|uniref:Hpt domain-containing protein n=1 Tax=Brevundimonas sp. Root1423 TaxID=1736462 RepID=UPI0006FA0DD0|nr:Hpt domain-containing protein [Brevundimonas sp. Root1423]KQY91315.1 hypothetical protein ASD25_19390 [Brevundimonas sp. Root1423]
MTDPLEALRARFIERCRTDLAVLKAAPDEAELALTIHRLAGSAGSFGFPTISAIAADIDMSLRSGDARSREQLDNLIRVLEDAFTG